MRILFNIGHPAQVHFFKNAFRILEKKGHVCKMTAVSKEVSLVLLDAYGIQYDVVGSAKPSFFSKGTELLKIEHKLHKIARSFKPDILVGGVGNAYIAHLGKMIGKPSVVFDDTEHAKIEHMLMDPFATVICTPSSFTNDLGKKQVRYNGYHELAYLHPNYFKPNPAVLKDLGLNEGDPFIILRFVSWDADHDYGHHGIQNKIKLATELEKYGKVFITSEIDLVPELEKYKLKIAPEKLHDMLYYATMCIGEGATVAVESALLGTPAIYISSLIGTMGNFIELEQKYGLILNYNDSAQALDKAVELLQSPDLKNSWIKKRDKLLEDKIDVTAFIVWFIENYPDSFKKIKEDKDIPSML